MGALVTVKASKITKVFTLGKLLLWVALFYFSCTVV